MRFEKSCLPCVLAMASLLAAAVQVGADDDQKKALPRQPLKIEARVNVVGPAEGEYWLGVHAVPADAALKSHLGIEGDRLIVAQVIDDSPAKKAGVQQHDLLLKFGDASIATIDDLLKAVDQSEGQAAKLELIRGGKQQSLDVTVEKRPENQGALLAEQPVDGVVQGLIGNWIQQQAGNRQGGGPMRWRILGPGVIDGNIEVRVEQANDAEGKLPKNLAIQVNKSGDSPAQIKVTRDGETWEVTEEKLDELPKDVREHVQRMLGGHAAAIGFGANGQNLRLKTLQVHPGIQVRPGQPLGTVVPAPSVTPQRRAVPTRVKAADEVDEVEQLRKDVEELKAAVKKLQGDKPKKVKRDEH